MSWWGKVPLHEVHNTVVTQDRLTAPVHLGEQGPRNDCHKVDPVHPSFRAQTAILSQGYPLFQRNLSQF